MRYFSCANVVVSLVLAVISTVVFSVSSASAQQVKDSNVRVLVCPQQGESYLNIIEPLSDTVINTDKVKIKGEVAYVSQVDVYINDVYNNSIAIGANATVFESQVSMAQGTNSIRFTATDTCYSSDIHSTTVVVSYQPAAQPSSGSETPTTIDNSPPRNIAVGQDIPEVSQPDIDGSDAGPSKGPLDDIARGFGIDATIQPGSLSVIGKVISILLGLITLIFGTVLAGYVKSGFRRARDSSSVDLSSRTAKTRAIAVRVTTIFIGACLIVFPFLL